MKAVQRTETKTKGRKVNNEQLKTQVENLTRYIVANPAENLRIWCETVETNKGDTIARFNNHLQACTAVRVIREQIQVAA